MDSMHQKWTQGYFVDSPRYNRWTPEQKQEANRKESLLVRPYPTDNAICVCQDPASAEWIAHRLNLCAKLEELAYNYAMGKDDGSAIEELVKSYLEG